MRLPALLLLSAFTAYPAFARTSYTGYSGAPGRQTCASSCHGQAGGTVQVTGFPETYMPGQTYLITIARLSGNSINQFNGSCRVGTGTTNAGTLAAASGTQTYNVTGETNGIRLASSNQTSATFNWTAPPTGTGTVRLYIGAYQGTSRTSGLNTTIVQVANETQSLPDYAYNPVPPYGAQNVPLTTNLSWTAGLGATSHDIYLDVMDPPDFIVNQTETLYNPPENLLAGTTYYWRIDERNAAGVTTGELWIFHTLAAPGLPSNPSPADGATSVPVAATLHWSAGAGTTQHFVSFGLTNPPPFVSTQTDTLYTPSAALLHDTVYYWQIEESNDAGVTNGPVWSFRTEQASIAGEVPAIARELTLGPAYPNPFNAEVVIPFSLPVAADLRLTIHDITGRQIAVLAAGNFAPGSHHVRWQANSAASGLYFARIQAGDQQRTLKIVALK